MSDWRYDKDWFANLHSTEKANYYKHGALQYEDGVKKISAPELEKKGAPDSYFVATATEELFVARTDWFFCFYYFMRWIHG
jgi:hypothetical protein